VYYLKWPMLIVAFPELIKAVQRRFSTVSKTSRRLSKDNFRGSRNNQVDKENASSERACKRALQPLDNINNFSISAKRCATGPQQQSMQTKLRYYTTWLSLITGRFTHFCEKYICLFAYFLYTVNLMLSSVNCPFFCKFNIKYSFVAVNGIENALNRYLTEFLHPDDVFWCQKAFYLCEFKIIITLLILRLKYSIMLKFLQGRWEIATILVLTS
jgi:hypothetical protein